MSRSSARVGWRKLLKIKLLRWNYPAGVLPRRPFWGFLKKRAGAEIFLESIVPMAKVEQKRSLQGEIGFQISKRSAGALSAFVLALLSAKLRIWRRRHPSC